jgi:antitoxin VapB
MGITAKLFKNGRSQAVRLPKDCQFKGKEVIVQKVGDMVVLLPKKRPWEHLMKAREMITDDFMTEGRDQGVAEEREPL